jgi:hypothetical protein
MLLQNTTTNAVESYHRYIKHSKDFKVTSAMCLFECMENLIKFDRKKVRMIEIYLNVAQETETYRYVKIVL